MRTLKQDTRGVILIITALLFPVLLAFLALALDVGKIYDLKRRTQNAANAGAIGGAYEVYRQNTTYGEVNQAGQEDSIKNGFDNLDSNVTVTINYPYTWQGVSGYVEAIVSETVPTYFARLFNQNNVTVRSRAVAGLGNYTSACVIALDPTAAKAMTIQGTVNFDVNCEIEVHSENPKGLIINGGSVCVQSAGIGVVGGYKVNGNPDPDCFKPKPVGDISYHEDPVYYAMHIEEPPSLQEPDATTAYPDLASACIWDTEIDGDQTLSPGYYCGSSYDVETCNYTLVPPNCTIETFYNPAIKISSGTVYLESGVYYLDSGMHISGGIITHDPNAPAPAGVLFYNTNQFWAAAPPLPENPDHWGQIRITGNAEVTLSGYQSYPYTGALIWEDSSAPTFKDDGGRREHVFAGTAILDLSGFVYAPNSELAWRGTNDTLGWFMIVANTIEMSGSPFGSGGSYSGGPPNPFQTVTLVE